MKLSEQIIAVLLDLGLSWAGALAIACGLTFLIGYWRG